jgi:hypothetical protein
MKKNVFGVIVGSLLAAATIAAQGAQGAAPQPPQQDKPKDVTVTGCVIQGSSPTVFLLDAARFNPQNKEEKARTYVLVAGTEDLMLSNHLNKEIAVTGDAEVKTPPTPPAGQKVQERDLPKFTVKAIAPVADRCTIAN